MAHFDACSRGPSAVTFKLKGFEEKWPKVRIIPGSKAKKLQTGRTFRSIGGVWPNRRATDFCRNKKMLAALYIRIS